MRVLAHIHTFNEADVIDGAVAAIERQTRRPDALIIVDNGSTDGTLDRAFPEWVTIIRNPENVGVSGSIGNGVTYALEHGFDWIWILDADSVPEPEALATLLDLYAGWPSTLQGETGFISCLPIEPPGRPLHGRLFTRNGRALISPPPQPRWYMCHVKVWSGSLYRLAAVREIGLPNPDYFLDRGELEYAYRVLQAGYKAFVHQDAILHHNIRGEPSPAMKRLRVGPITVTFYEMAPLRCYFVCRNTLYFTLYDLKEGVIGKFRELWRLRSRPGRSMMSGVAWQTALLTLNFVLRPRTHRAHIVACLRGVWHGLTGNMAARY
jgi:glycosyltransferase involved in cell wall biosynthesis